MMNTAFNFSGYKIFVTFLLITFVVGKSFSNTDPYPVIPKPVKSNVSEGVFDFKKINGVYFSKPFKTDPSKEFVSWLEDYFAIKIKRQVEKSGAIQFIQTDTFSQKEAYHLEIKKEGINVFYKDEVGAFYACQTLKQLFPVEKKYLAENSYSKIEIPCGDIYDYPHFSYRGMHLDESRHFFGTAAVKKYIDMLAFQKMNYMHWHLTDDQGWRIEIKKYPKLTQIGGCRAETRVGHYSDRPIKYDGEKYCHFYTQEEIKEIVKYAEAHFITIVPEIELPGHAMAALSAYPELGCTGEKIGASTTWGVFEDIFCPKEATFLFLNNVLDEVIDLFPSKYIHIGGDEVPKKQWKENAYCQKLIREKKLKDEHGLQSYFIRRIEQHINSRGRTIIGWDEILEGGLAPNAVVMSWRGIEGGIEAANQNHYVIMTPGSHCYFDYYQAKGISEPIAIGGFVPLKKVYSFDPVPPKLAADKHKYILGGQANLWTEYIANVSHLQYMAHPRSFALAEAVWSPKVVKNYDDFLSRLVKQVGRLDAWGINYAKHFYGLDINRVAMAGKSSIQLKTDANDKSIQYRISQGKTNTAWLDYSSPFDIENEGTVESRVIDKSSEAVYTSARKEYKVSLTTGKQFVLKNEPNDKYNAGGVQALSNSFFGPNDNYGGDEWLGFLGKNIEVEMDLGSSTQLNNAELRFYNDNPQWVHGPREIEIYGANEKDQWTKIEESAELTENGKIIKAKIYLNKKPYRYVKIVVNRHGIIEPGLAGEGTEAWLFCDEIVIY